SLYTFIFLLFFIIVIIVILFNLERSEEIIDKIARKFLPEKFHSEIRKVFVSLINGFLFIKYPKYYLQIFLLTVLLWFSYVCSTYLTFLAFDMDLNLLDANLVLTMITFAVTVPLPANSAGIYHFFCTATLVNIYGINSETAFGYATVSHLLGLLSLILIGAYFFLKENLTFKKAKEFTKSETEPETG
ncbi:MAG TPA: lysylphosphatidylglycerol synthase domain-containing protein, partial [Ignavibacteria bacterium]|nr:lysylphosphatidylglycerol synthase domain-containing protein [Ignavibacteria bacterium]